MLKNLLKKNFNYRILGFALAGFKKEEESLVEYFTNDNNEDIFVDSINRIEDYNVRILFRDYYLALLHHVSKSEYYSSSFLMSTTTIFSEAHKFAWSKENASSKNPVIICGWVPVGYQGVLNAPDYRILISKVDIESLKLPTYRRSFFPNQKEVTLKGGLFPNYLIGYLHYDEGEELFEINPAMFDVAESWNGIELPVNQATFYMQLKNTAFGRFFSINDVDQRFRQHSI